MFEANLQLIEPPLHLKLTTSRLLRLFKNRFARANLSLLTEVANLCPTL